ncbi:MAG: hypothetical protein QXO22_04205 [Thermosphaera sp.]
MSEKERLKKFLEILEKELEDEARKPQPNLNYILLVSRAIIEIKKLLDECWELPRPKGRGFRDCK